MNSLATSVVSAAVIGGELILGLSDGSIINAGFVQGPQGLKGDQGPMGATGRSGTDGNTILTVAGAPDTTLGKDGDYAINTTVWEIYGPRSGGVWGAGTPLRGNTRAGGETGVPLFGESSGDSSGGGGRTYTTGNLPCPARASLRTFARRAPESALPAETSFLGQTISLIRATSTAGSLTRCLH